MAIKVYVDPHITDEDDAHDASAVSFVPSGTISADNVQAAIEEVALEAVAGTIPDGSIGIQKLAFDVVTQEELGAAGHLAVPQIAASAAWIIEHNLGFYPAVTVVDTAGNVVFGEVQYLSLNTVRISFSAPFSGVAYFS